MDQSYQLAPHVSSFATHHAGALTHLTEYLQERRGSFEGMSVVARKPE